MVDAVASVIYPVKDLASAKEQYNKLLGIEPYFDQPFYVGFKAGEQEIGLDPNGHAEGMTGPVAYWRVEDIKKSVEQYVAVGATAQQAVHEVGGGIFMASVKDSDGNTIGLIQQP